MPDISTVTTAGVTYDIKDEVARAAGAIVTLNVAAFSRLPKTISNDKITSDMVLLRATFSNPGVFPSDVTWTTSNGNIRLSGTMSGSTSAQLVLGKSKF